METVRITSIKQLRDEINVVLDSINSDPLLLTAAAANPLLALDELGYNLSLKVRYDIEDLGRFSKPQIAKRRKLRKEIFEAAGRPFEISSPAELRDVLFDQLDFGGKYKAEPDVSPLAPRLSVSADQADAESDDPLSVLRGAHPIMEPLLEYRQIDAATPGFASRAGYQKIRRGEMGPRIFKMRARLSKRLVG